SFYLPEARTQAGRDTFVYYQKSERPENQFYFWPGYSPQRRGQNAIYVREVDGPDLPGDWLSRWLKGGKEAVGILDVTTEKIPPPAPPELLREFESVNDLGSHPVF